MHQMIVAFFRARGDAESAVQRLQHAGWPEEGISLLPKHVARLGDIGLACGSKIGDGAALGALFGGLAGALLGGLAGGGALVVPPVGAVYAGPLVAALAGAGALGGASMLVGALAGARLPRFEARLLRDAVRWGGALVAVRCGPRDADRAAQLLAEAGGTRIRESTV